MKEQCENILNLPLLLSHRKLCMQSLGKIKPGNSKRMYALNSDNPMEHHLIIVKLLTK